MLPAGRQAWGGNTAIAQCLLLLCSTGQGFPMLQDYHTLTATQTLKCQPAEGRYALSRSCKRRAQRQPRTVGLHPVGDAGVHALVLLVPLHILPDSLHGCHRKYKHQRCGGAVAAEGRDHTPPRQPCLQQGSRGEGKFSCLPACLPTTPKDCAQLRSCVVPRLLPGQLAQAFRHACKRACESCTSHLPAP